MVGVLVALIVGQAVIIAMLAKLVQNQATLVTALWERIRGASCQTNTQTSTGGSTAHRLPNSTVGLVPPIPQPVGWKSGSTATK